MLLLCLFLSLVCPICIACYLEGPWSIFRRQESQSSQVVFIDPSTSVLPSESFRASSHKLFEPAEPFNPTSSSPPFFQVFHPDFLSILGPNPSLTEIASNASYAFAHEAPVYNEETDEVFFSSMIAGPMVDCGLERNNFVSKIRMGDVEEGVRWARAPVDVPVEKLDLGEDVQMTNGGTGPYNGSLFLITSGRGTRPSSIVAVNPKPPYNTTVLLNNFYGRQFNSLNDAKIHPSGKIFVTDAPYGAQLGFRPPATLPNQVYRFDPVTKAVRVVAADFDICNGIAFNGDGTIAYVSDTGSTGGPTRPSTIYAFDVDPTTHVFTNRRVFAYADIGIPDGIIVDTNGNVYSGAGDGVHVWNPSGTLLGKFFIGMVSANMAFAGDGHLVILAETKVFVAKIAAKSIKLSYP